MDEAFEKVGFLGFDVYGTVVDWRSSIAASAAPFLARHGIRIDPETFADEWRLRYDPAMEKCRSGVRPWVRLETLNLEMLRDVLANLGVEPGAVPESELAELNAAWGRLDPWPDSVDALTRLRQRFALGAISNGSIAGMMRVARHADLQWDAILGAEIARNYKPLPETYLRSLEAVDYLPAQSAMVAAHNGDLAAARALGMKTVFVYRTREWGDCQTTDLEPTGDWDLVVRNLAELADALDC